MACRRVETLATGTSGGAAAAGADEIGELARDTLPARSARADTVQGQPDLLAGVAAAGQLQVPAGVLAAGAPPQRDPGPQEPQVLRVVVDGHEQLLGRAGRRGYLRQAVQRGQHGIRAQPRT